MRVRALIVGPPPHTVCPQHSLDVGDRQQPDGTPGGIDDHGPADASEGWPLQHACHVLVERDEQGRVAVGQLPRRVRRARSADSSDSSRATLITPTATPS